MIMVSFAESRRIEASLKDKSTEFLQGYLMRLQDKSPNNGQIQIIIQILKNRKKI